MIIIVFHFTRSAKNAKRSISSPDSWRPARDWWHRCSSISCTNIRGCWYSRQRYNTTNSSNSSNSRLRNSNSLPGWSYRWRPRTGNRHRRRSRLTCRQSPATQTRHQCLAVIRPTRIRRPCRGTVRPSHGRSKNSSDRSVQTIIIMLWNVHTLLMLSIL